MITATLKFKREGGPFADLRAAVNAVQNASLFIGEARIRDKVIEVGVSYEMDIFDEMPVDEDDAERLLAKKLNGADCSILISPSRTDFAPTEKPYHGLSDAERSPSIVGKRFQ